jgi:membrane-associated phospholipid phosphatase
MLGIRRLRVNYSQRVAIRPRYLLAVAALCAGGVALLRVLAFDVAGLHRRDALALHDFMLLDRPLTHHVADVVANLASPPGYALIGGALIAIALARGRRPVALAAATILLGSAVTTDDVLKPALAAPRFAGVLQWHQIGSASFPSGHATASMALALCGVLVPGARWRPLAAAVGAAFAIAVSYAFLSLGWHYPSDVLGGYLVAAFWASVAVATLSWWESRQPASTARRRSLPAFAWGPAAGAVLLVMVVALAALAVVSPERTLHYMRDHAVFTAAAGAIAAAGVFVAGGLAVALRDRPD